MSKKKIYKRLSLKEKIAFDKSVWKWKLIVCGEAPDEGRSNCPLCIHYIQSCYLDRWDPDKKKQCPVFFETGQRDCNGSPYEAWRSYVLDDNLRNRVFDKTSFELAKDELRYLMSFLPDNHDYMKELEAILKHEWRES